MRTVAAVLIATFLLGCQSPQEQKPAPAFDFTIDAELEKPSGFKDIVSEPPEFISEPIIVIAQ